ncbi:MAG: hypothetical protein GX594_09620 [Pirellulaceae bacterium]|nr:hypothetical protein [Pirellulaceae bacterium]
MKLKLILFTALASIAVLTIGQAAASIHTGSLDLDGGGLAVGGDGGWAGGNPTFSWSISNEADGGPGGNFVWLYSYNFNVAKPGAVSHFILETSIGTTSENFRRFANAILHQGGVQVWTSQQGNPNMPGDVNGIKLDPAESESLNWSFSFWADREPV